MPLRDRSGAMPMNSSFLYGFFRFFFTASLLIIILAPSGYSSTLTETVHTLQENTFEFSAGISYLGAVALFRKEQVSIAFGVRDDISITYSIDYLHRETEGSGSTVGDSLLKIWYYAGEFAQDRVCWGIAGIVRIPTGPSLYADERWQPVSSGIHEIKIGPVFQASLLSFFLHANLFYVFRQAEGENFYGGFKFKPFERESYTSVVGCNPWHEGAFADKNRLKNDYASAAVSLLADRYFPIIFYTEVYYSHRVAGRTTENDTIPVEGAGVNPLFIGGGMRYFISQETYLGLYGMVLAGSYNAYVRWIAGFSVSAVF